MMQSDRRVDPHTFTILFNNFVIERFAHPVEALEFEIIVIKTLTEI